MPCVLVSCCGLPAAGKTTFCRSIINGYTASCPVPSSPKASTHVSDDFVTSPIPDSVDPSNEFVTPELILPAGEGKGSTGKVADANTPQKLRLRGHTSKTKTLRLKDQPLVIQVSHVCFDEHIDRACRHYRHRHRNRPSGTNGASQQEEEEGERVPGGDEGGQVDSVSIEEHRSVEEISETYRYAVKHGCELLDGGESYAEWWHEGRRGAMAKVEALAAAAAATRTTPDPLSNFSLAELKSALEEGTYFQAAEERDTQIQGGEGQQTNTLMQVVLVDDNMHFRSMRHEVLRIARTCG